MSYIRGATVGACGEDVDELTAQLEHARSRFRSFHARPAGPIVSVGCRRTIPKVLVQLGALRGLIYAADRGDGGVRSYIHFMDRPPQLACDPSGTQLYVIGGRYRITRRGIEG